MSGGIESEISSMANIFVFGTMDYIVFVLMLAISAGIGAYFGFFAKGADTTDEYLLGGKQMKTWPIAISLVASQLSAISIMTIPAEMYSFGFQFFYTIVAMIFVLPTLMFIIVPVFYKNNISNCYEYLERRFDKKTRQLVTVSFLITIYFVIPVYIFIPSLAFAQVTGLNIHLINGVVCSICIFYTMLGGIKAVVWTDVVQGMIMVGSVVVVGTLAAMKIGGVGEVLRRAYDGGRLDTVWTLDITTRSTFWNSFITGIFMWTGHVGLNQSCVQRIVALPSFTNAKKSLVIFSAGLVLIMTFNCFTGIVMYARYEGCDPLKAGVVEKADKMMPYFVQDIVGNLSGMPGFFISCVFSAALSTMSANLNSLSGIVYFDYIKPFVNHTESKANFIMKAVVVVTGLYCILAGFIVEKFSSIFQMVMTIGGVTHGAIFGAFMLAFLVPRAHAKAAFWSIIMSMGLMLYFILSVQYKLKTGVVKYTPLPSSIEHCDAFDIVVSEQILMSVANSTVRVEDYLSTYVEDDNRFSLTSMAFNWFSVCGAALVWIFGIPLSYILKDDENKKLDPMLLAPIVQRFVPKSLSAEYQEVPLSEKAKEAAGV